MACLIDCSRFSSVRERCSNEEPSWINITAPQTISWKHYQNISLGVDSWINLGHLKFKILPWRVVVRVVILRDTNRQIDVRFRCLQHSLQLKSYVIETWPTFCIRMPSRQHHLISIIKKILLEKLPFCISLNIDQNTKGFNFNVIEKCDAYFGIVCLKIYKANE